MFFFCVTVLLQDCHCMGQLLNGANLGIAWGLLYLLIILLERE